MKSCDQLRDRFSLIGTISDHNSKVNLVISYLTRLTFRINLLTFG